MFEALKLFGEEVAGEHKIDVAIVFVKRTAVRQVIRQELKDAGIETIIGADTAEACREEMVRHERALLVVDWENGPDVASEVLRAAQGSFNIDTRPIYLLASQVDEDIVAIGIEFNVTCIHTGEVSRTKIKEHLEFILSEETSSDSLRASLIRVADARARGDWSLASMMLLELYSQHPDNERVGVELANNLLQEEKWEEARDLASGFIDSGSKNLRALHVFARCMMHEGDFAAATNALKRAKLISPYYVDRLVDLGNCLMSLDRVSEARENFEDALKLEQTNRRAMIGKGQCGLLEGELNEALAMLKSISGPRELSSIFNSAAILSVHQNRFDEGMKLYETAVAALGQKNRVLARLVFNMGVAYYKWKKLDEALECFEQAFSLDSRFDKAHHNATILSGVMGRTADFTGILDKTDDEESLGAPAPGLSIYIDEVEDDFSEEVIDRKVGKL